MILVTGHKGYIGSHLIQKIGKFEGCDLKDGRDFRKIEGRYFSAVIHLAAHASVTQSLENPDECLDNNAFGLIPFLSKNKVDRFIFASTGGAMYGDKHFAREEEACWKGCLSPYGQSKYIAEQIIQRLHSNYAVLRFGNVCGGNDKNRLEKAAHAHFATDDPIIVYGWRTTRDFVSVDVICDALIRAANSDITGIFNLGSGVESRVDELAEEYGKKRGVSVLYEPLRDGEIQHISLDVSKAQKAGLL